MTKALDKTNDPVFGMTVDETSALHAERDGETFSFTASVVSRSF